MSIIQLSPQLQRTVHMLKRIEMREDASPLLTELSLSKIESSAAVRTFNRPANNRQKELVKLAGDWF